MGAKVKVETVGLTLQPLGIYCMVWGTVVTWKMGAKPWLRSCV